MFGPSFTIALIFTPFLRYFRYIQDVYQQNIFIYAKFVNNKAFVRTQNLQQHINKQAETELCQAQLEQWWR